MADNKNTPTTERDIVAWRAMTSDELRHITDETQLDFIRYRKDGVQTRLSGYSNPIIITDAREGK